VTSVAAKILTDALALSSDERRALAAELLASVDDLADADWEHAWQTEVDQRAAASDARTAPSPEWSEVRARVLSKLAKLAKLAPR
jgi:hypothetical protein